MPADIGHIEGSLRVSLRAVAPQRPRSLADLHGDPELGKLHACASAFLGRKKLNEEILASQRISRVREDHASESAGA